MNPNFPTPEQSQQLAEGALRVQAVYAATLLIALLGCALTITLLYYQRVAERRAAAAREADLRLELEMEREDHEKQIARIRTAWERSEEMRQRHQDLLARRHAPPQNPRGTMTNAWIDAISNAHKN